VRLTGAGGALTDARELARRALDAGVAFVPGTPFFVNKPDASSLRLSFATVPQDAIVEGIARLGRVLH